MKVQVIRSNNAGTFQEQVNSFIEGKKVADIKYNVFPVTTEYSGGVPVSMVFYDSALILYEEE